jgi:soluble lytic murein transglycosylase-like protein
VRLEPAGFMQRTFAYSLTTAALAFGLAAAADGGARAAAQAPLQTTPATIAVYASVLHHINPQLPQWQSRDLARRVLVNAERWRLDANMLVAIVTVESRWHTHAVSRAGAIGLGQLMPGTAARLGVNPRDPGENISGAARYLSGLRQRFGSNHYNLVFAAYNAGPKAVTEYGGIPPFGETEHYVVRVMTTWQHLSKTVRVPSEALAFARGPDIDYWLDATH